MWILTKTIVKNHSFFLFKRQLKMLRPGPLFRGFGYPKPAQNRRPRFFPYLTTFIKKCFFKKFQSLYSVKKNFKQLFTFLTFLSLHSFRPKNAKNLFFCGFSGFSCILPIRKFFFGLYDLLYVFPCLATIIPDSYRPFFVYI